MEENRHWKGSIFSTIRSSRENDSDTSGVRFTKGSISNCYRTFDIYLLAEILRPGIIRLCLPEDRSAQDWLNFSTGDITSKKQFESFLTWHPRRFTTQPDISDDCHMTPSSIETINFTP
ncbi:hypothetical protein Bind_3760 (plasmid) [Beijerinckia indica subsp. indica ATCC 9039]|uniref:Uncharacterized protein n=1 Tax=Beijerinckia indica subsp. indica (strain ATCC 9039 / DSM 1715 / NCIMB 8712) TaxID=395963 RepID=B2ILA7_BEII9|nr:hypothetical protein Bind_3760 [Beijerinckia indica subsp. indica ATCC 9039]